MQKLDAESPQAMSTDFIADNVARLKALFPELVTEGPDGASVDVDVLKALVGERTVGAADERYGFHWHGKRSARQAALTPSTGTLRPCPDDSVAWDDTRHLVIEGDNLDVMKLLHKSYAGKVKLVYIDPPYNTGSDFVYPDDFSDSIRHYLAMTGQTDGGVKRSTNTEANGRFHTDWLNMMYPRLKLAHALLSDEGLIAVHIDEHEVHALVLMLREIFGEENELGVAVWDKRNPKGDARGVAYQHESLVLFARNAETLLEQAPLKRPKRNAQRMLDAAHDAVPQRQREGRAEGVPRVDEGADQPVRRRGDVRPAVGRRARVPPRVDGMAEQEEGAGRVFHAADPPGHRPAVRDAGPRLAQSAGDDASADRARPDRIRPG